MTRHPERSGLAGLLALAGLYLSAPARPAQATALDSHFEESLLVSSPLLQDATSMAWAPDGSGRLFVTRHAGEVRVVKNGVVLDPPFATLSPLYMTGETGLLGIAFDPDFLHTRYVYLFVTISESEQHIVRYVADGDVGTAKTSLITGLPSLPINGRNHDGGALGFGPDGKLYWGVGDLGVGIGGDGDLQSLACKVARANRDGRVPADNPFVDGDKGNNDYVWARGFRNPYSLAFQPATGLLWLNVVGADTEQIFIVRPGDNAGWSTYENNQPAGFLTPVIEYHTHGSTHYDLRTDMSGAVRESGRVTFTTAARHGLRAGEWVTIAGVADPSFNARVLVLTVPTPTSFTVAQAGSNASSGGGTVTTLDQGGCVSGGVFYDATQFAPEYRGNYFYGDYNSQRIMRATLDPTTNAVTSVDYFAIGGRGQIDLSVGPDGALYYIGHDGNVFRLTYRAAAQGLVVSPTTLWTGDGESVTANVRLAVAPAGPVTVSVARTAGDPDIVVSGGASLTFTPLDWNVPQTVTVTARHDGDATDDDATLTVTAAGLEAQLIVVHAHDEAAGEADGGADAPAGDDASLEDASPAAMPDAGAVDAAADQSTDASAPDSGAPDVLSEQADAVDAAAGDAPEDGPSSEGDAATPDGGADLVDAPAGDLAFDLAELADLGSDGIERSGGAGDAAATDAGPGAVGDAPTDTASASGLDGGCGCRMGGEPRAGAGTGGGLAALVLLVCCLTRRRRLGQGGTTFTGLGARARRRWCRPTRWS